MLDSNGSPHEEAKKNAGNGKKNFRSIGDLADLCTSEFTFEEAPELDIEVPEVDTSGLSALEAIATRLRAKKEVALKLASRLDSFVKWMRKVALPFIHSVNKNVDELGDEYLKEEYTDATGNRHVVGKKRKEYREKIDAYQRDGRPIVTLTIEAAEKSFWLSIEPLDKDDLMTRLEKLVKEDVLEERDDGDINTFQDRHFSLANRFMELLEPHRSQVKSDIAEAIGNQVKRIRGEYEEEKSAIIADFKKKATMSTSDVLDPSKTGTCFMYVPYGAILVKVNDHDLEMLDAVGRPENGFCKLKGIEQDWNNAGKITLPRKDLVDQEGNLAQTIKIKVPPMVARSKSRKDWIDSGLFFFYAVINCLKAVQAREEKRARGEISWYEFQRQHKLGKFQLAVYNWNHKFLGEDRKVKKEVTMDKLRLEVERFLNEGETETRIRLTKWTAEHEEVLEEAGCLSQTGYFEGQAYDELPHMLKNILRFNFNAGNPHKSGRSSREKRD